MSQFIRDGAQKHKSRLIKATKDFAKDLGAYTIDPSSKGVFGSKAKITCGGVTINSDDLDVEFEVKFDDDLEPNEAEVTVYNLSDNTINKFGQSALKYKNTISIEAGFNDDIGLIFKGYVKKLGTTYSGADKVTTISCFDEVVRNDTIEETYTNKSASEILRDLINRTGTPVRLINTRRDHQYDGDQKVDGTLTANIKHYSEVCGVSTYVRNGVIYSQYIKDGENISFTVSEETGMIGSPSPYEEEYTYEEYKDTINGYDIEMLLNHRIAAGVIFNVKSMFANGKYRVRSGSHSFSIDECVTKVKVIDQCATEVIPQDDENE